MGNTLQILREVGRLWHSAGLMCQDPVRWQETSVWQEVRKMVCVEGGGTCPSPGETDQAHTRCTSTEPRLTHSCTHTCSLQLYFQSNTIHSGQKARLLHHTILLRRSISHMLLYIMWEEKTNESKQKHSNKQNRDVQLSN